MFGLLGAARAGVENITRSLAVEWAEQVKNDSRHLCNLKALNILAAFRSGKKFEIVTSQ